MPYAIFPTAIGQCLLRWENEKIIRFELPGFAAQQDGPPEVIPTWVELWIERVQQHLSGTMHDFADAPFAFETVTPFQKEVYLAALGVLPGEVKTYGWLANKLGKNANASRAVGHALGRNPWPLLVPCHRFVGANGKLTGFSASGGIATKRQLLALEETATSLADMAAAI